MNEFDEFQEMMKMVDMKTFSMADQLRIMMAWGELIEKVKPIYLKNMAKDPGVTNFIVKL